MHVLIKFASLPKLTKHALLIFVGIIFFLSLIDENFLQIRDALHHLLL